MNKDEIIKEAMRELGRRSANSPMRTKEYYAERGRKSAALRKERKLKRIEEEKSPTSILTNLLTGKI